ncbi:MAG: 30S ribosomal protein S20 [Clostridia bacterium]|nr:30S ribosomal protein S20 [Clostridia bacterium]
MPNIKSAKKRVKVINTKTARNKAYMSSLRTIVKSALNEGAGETGEAVKAAIKKIDQAVSKGILHKNTAARKKARVIRVARGQ